MKKRTLIIIPCFNEQDRIEELLLELQRLPNQHEILVVDDGSIDRTFEIASRLAKVARHSVNLGIGGAVQTGLKYAQANNFQSVVQCDGDGQHPPDQISVLISHAESNDLDFVVGSRFKGIQSFTSTRLRRLGIRIISTWLKLLFGKEFLDVTSGFRYMSKSTIDFLVDRYPQDFPEPLSLGMAISKKLQVGEVGVIMRERISGKSSISGWKSASYVIRVVGYLSILKLKGNN